MCSARCSSATRTSTRTLCSGEPHDAPTPTPPLTRACRARYEMLRSGRHVTKGKDWAETLAVKNSMHRVEAAEVAHQVFDCSANPNRLVCSGCKTAAEQNYCAHVAAVNHLIEAGKPSAEREPSIDLLQVTRVMHDKKGGTSRQAVQTTPDQGFALDTNRFEKGDDGGGLTKRKKEARDSGELGKAKASKTCANASVGKAGEGVLPLPAKAGQAAKPAKASTATKAGKPATKAGKPKPAAATKPGKAAVDHAEPTGNKKASAAAPAKKRAAAAHKEQPAASKTHGREGGGRLRQRVLLGSKPRPLEPCERAAGKGETSSSEGDGPPSALFEAMASMRVRAALPLATRARQRLHAHSAPLPDHMPCCLH